MSKTKSSQMQILEQCINVINREYPFRKSLKWQKNRECLSGKFPLAVMRYLAAHADAVEKITYDKGANAYRYYAPIGFEALVIKLLMTWELESALAKKTDDTTTRAKI